MIGGDYRGAKKEKNRAAVYFGGRWYVSVLLIVLVLSMPFTFAAELKLNYDANGNLVTGDGKFRVYNSLNQLTAIYNGTDASGVLLETYTYHPTEERILAKKVYLSNGTLNQTVYYLSPTFVRIVSNLGGSSSNDTLPQMVFNDAFCTSDMGYTGYNARDATQCSLNKSTSSGNIVSPSESFESNYSDNVADFNITFTFKYSGGSNNKFYPTVICSSLGSTTNRFNFESQNSTHFHIKADRGGFSSTSNFAYNTTQTALFETNVTNNVSRACVGSSCTNWETYARDAGQEDCFAMSFSNVAGGAFQIFSVTGYQNLKAYNTTTGTNQDYVYVHHEGQLVAQRNPDGSVIYIHGNHEGSSSVVTDSSGAVLERTDYSPFGEQLSKSSVRYGYEGKESDSLVGDTDFSFRKYKPQWGLFLQPDTIIQNVYEPQSLNRYAFERNNPYKHTDSTGHLTATCNFPQDGCIPDLVVGTFVLVIGFVGGAFAFNALNAREDQSLSRESYDFYNAYGEPGPGDAGRRILEQMRGDLEAAQHWKDILSMTQNDVHKDGETIPEPELEFSLYPLFGIVPSTAIYRSAFDTYVQHLFGPQTYRVHYKTDTGGIDITFKRRGNQLTGGAIGDFAMSPGFAEKAAQALGGGGGGGGNWGGGCFDCSNYGADDWGYGDGGSGDSGS